MQAEQLQLDVTSTIEQVVRSAPAEPPDICRRKHGGNTESEAANLQTNKERDRARLIAELKQAPRTCYELSQITGIPYTTCSARCSELREKGTAVPTGEKRPTGTGSLAAVLGLVKGGE